MKSKFLIVAAIVLATVSCKQSPKQYITNNGFVYGTVYHMVYESPDGTDLHDQINEELNRFDLSLSTFNPNSVISSINNNSSTITDTLFDHVFIQSEEIWKISQGAFDPTVAPLVNAWGFGFKHAETISDELIDSLLQLVGFDKIKLENGEILKNDQRIMLDFNAIAKGYAVDVIGALLHKLGCKNYMVEIGGEVTTLGFNPSGKAWRIGINEPNENEPVTPAQLQAIVSISGKALATSGNYRNFYEKDGKKFAHTIDPKTGYPVKHNLLSATVLANNCMQADALATAFMVLGVEQSLTLANNLIDIETFLIYADENGERKVITSDGFEKYLAEN